MGQYRPTHARHLVGQRHYRLVVSAPLDQMLNPAAQAIFLPVGMTHYGPGAVDQQPSQIAVSPFADTQ